MSKDRELLAANLKRISDGDQRGMHVSATHYAWLGNALAWNERINADLIAALQGMYRCFGNPHRLEYLNDAGYEDARASCDAARNTITKALNRTGTVDPKCEERPINESAADPVRTAI